MNLNGRVDKLECTLLASADSVVCATCSLPYVRLPLPLAVGEAIVRYSLGASDRAPHRLCLCRPCCNEGIEIARLTHELPVCDAA